MNEKVRACTWLYGESTSVKTIDLSTWEDFEQHVSVRTEEETKMLREACYPIGITDMLFRGLADSSWSLATSLERVRPDLSFSEYLFEIAVIENVFNSHTSSQWNIRRKIERYRRKDRDFFLELGTDDFSQILDFMAHLRHCGFPSPLLDWTASPYVAAFFAFREDISNRPSDRVAIYAYRNLAGDMQVYCEEYPHIWRIAGNLKTHRRHYIQQADYTLAIAQDITRGYVFARHEDANPTDSVSGQIIKYTIPSSERVKVLRKLKFMNITDYSLFGTEDALARTLGIDLAMREEWEHRKELRKRWMQQNDDIPKPSDIDIDDDS
jgi:hypothetical protein